ncbi:MAG: TonB-dependent receptor plug domain-containing protein, partial [Gammaproteobacteria bacterium]
MSKWVHASSVLALVCGILAPAAAVADDASDAAPEGTLQEVIVTSQRRQTEVQTTAAAVSAYSAADLEMQSATSVEALATLNPSVLVSLFQGEAQIYIRGIGYSSVVGGSDSSTAFHSDGVYISRSAGAVPAFMDVERIEVLRGPQGTLYGRNATGGSVNVITKGPGKEPEYEASLTMGNYDLVRAFAAVSVPVSDRVGIRFAAQREKRSGYTTVTRPIDDPAGLGVVRSDVEDTDSWAARLTLDAQFTDSFRAIVKADYYEANDAATVWHYFSPGTSTNPVYQALVPQSVRSEPYSRHYGSDLAFFNRPRIGGISTKLEWELGDV